MERLEQARLYLVCGRTSRAFLDEALNGGVDIVQLRIKDAGEEEILDAARVVREACRERGALFILNDRPELVTAAQADGVHVGQADTPVSAARTAIGPDRIVGLSTHTPEQVQAGGREADYIGVGPVYETPTKPGRPAVGLELVRHAAAHAEVPFFAIGGIDPSNVDEVVAAGGRRIAVVRALTEAESPGQAAASLRRALERQEASVGTT